MTPTTPSVSLMLIRGQLVQGHAIERSTAIVATNADDAWAQLLTAGECAMVADGDEVRKLRSLHAAWLADAVCAEAWGVGRVTA
jgi:hypothetical protein